MFHLPYKLRNDGGDCLVAIASGKDVAVNVILGMPFITGMGMVLDFKDNVATCNAIDHPPFAIDLCCTARTVPASAVGVNAGISVHPVVAELEHYEQWRSSQVALTHSNQSRRVFFRDVSSSSTFDASLPAAASPSTFDASLPAAASPSTLSESQTILHHNVPRLDGFM